MSLNTLLFHGCSGMSVGFFAGYNNPCYYPIRDAAMAKKAIGKEWQEKLNIKKRMLGFTMISSMTSLVLAKLFNDIYPLGFLIASGSRLPLDDSLVSMVSSYAGFCAGTAARYVKDTKSAKQRYQMLEAFGKGQPIDEFVPENIVNAVGEQKTALEALVTRGSKESDASEKSCEKIFDILRNDNVRTFVVSFPLMEYAMGHLCRKALSLKLEKEFSNYFANEKSELTLMGHGASKSPLPETGIFKRGSDFYRIKINYRQVDVAACEEDQMAVGNMAVQISKIGAVNYRTLAEMAASEMENSPVILGIADESVQDEEMVAKVADAVGSVYVSRVENILGLNGLSLKPGQQN